MTYNEMVREAFRRVGFDEEMILAATDEDWLIGQGYLEALVPPQLEPGVTEEDAIEGLVAMFSELKDLPLFVLRQLHDATDDMQSEWLARN